MAVAHRYYPAVMDHQKGTAANLNIVPGHSNNRSGAGSNAQHFYSDFPLVLAEKVVNCQSFKHIAARGVDVYRHICTVH